MLNKWRTIKSLGHEIPGLFSLTIFEVSNTLWPILIVNKANGCRSRRSRLSTTPSKPTGQRQLGAKRKLRKWRGQWRTRLFLS